MANMFVPVSVRSLVLMAFAGILSGQTGPGGTALRPGNSYEPITANKRVEWVAVNTVGVPSLTGGLISAAWGTLFNQPKEYGPHWEGFGKRYGMRLTGVATSNVMEAGLGAIWGEDPRYTRAAGESFLKRVGHVFKMAFVAQNRDGRLMPAYARYIAITGNNYLSNTWRADREATLERASIRVGLGFLGRISGNAFAEFWPDVRDRLSEGHADRAAAVPPRK